MRVRRRGVVVGLLGLAGVMGVAATAVACTAWTGMYPLSSPAGPPGTEVTVKGTSPVGGPVEIRWDGLHGPVIGRAWAPQTEGGHDSGEFTARVRIPKAEPGVHYVVVVGPENSGWSRAAFKIPEAPLRANKSPQPVTDAGRAGELLSDQPLWSRPETGATSTAAPGMGVGVALLSVGTLTLLAGAAVAGVRRRRVRAR